MSWELTLLKPVTVEEMRTLEADADYFGVTRGMLMENAGRKAAESIIALQAKCQVLVVCGTGNNGGDGFVTARYLEKAGYGVSAVLLGRVGRVRPGPALVNLEILRGMGVPIVEAESPDAVPRGAFENCDLIVDAVLGTGLAGVPGEPARTAIRLMNASPAKKVSLDVPSGLDAHTGECAGCVDADLVVAFHAPKKGLDRFRAEVADIGIPEKAFTHTGPGVLACLRSRGDFPEKGGGGRVLVIGGGPYAGAPALAAMAAYRAGAEIVTIAAPRRAAGIIASYSPDLIVRPLGDDEAIVGGDVEPLKALAARHHAVVVGVGLGRAAESLEAVARVLPSCPRPVIDADALQAGMPLRGIVTPSVHEFARIGGRDLMPGDPDAAGPVRSFSREMGVVTVWKGRPAVISDGEAVRINSTGNPGMAVGGAGDVLAGVIGAFYCRNGAFEAACAGAFLSGAAGDLAFGDLGFGLVATDIVRRLPLALKKYRPGGDEK